MSGLGQIPCRFELISPVCQVLTKFKFQTSFPLSLTESVSCQVWTKFQFWTISPHIYLCRDRFGPNSSLELVSLAFNCVRFGLHSSFELVSLVFLCVRFGLHSSIELVSPVLLCVRFGLNSSVELMSPVIFLSLPDLYRMVLLLEIYSVLRYDRRVEDPK